MYLKKGDIYTGEDLLYGLILSSETAPAWAIAELPKVVLLRRFRDDERAGQGIGAINAVSKPAWPQRSNHYTTAFDLAYRRDLPGSTRTSGA